MPASRYLGAPKWASLLARLLGKETMLPIVQGLERDGQVLLRPFCPPYYSTMTDAVKAFVETKFGAQGLFCGGAANSVWREPQGTAQQIPAPSEAAIAATSAYCDYIYQRYGRFPAYSAPFRTILGDQATHVDAEFYERFYQADTLSETQWATYAVLQQAQRLQRAASLP